MCLQVFAIFPTPPLSVDLHTRIKPNIPPFPPLPPFPHSLLEVGGLEAKGEDGHDDDQEDDPINHPRQLRRAWDLQKKVQTHLPVQLRRVGDCMVNIGIGEPMVADLQVLHERHDARHFAVD